MRAAFTLAVGTAGAALFVFLHAPLAYMLGAMTFTAVLAMVGAPVALSSRFRTLSMPIIGVMLGGYFTPELIAHVGQWWPGLLAVVAMMAATTVLGPLFFTRLFGFDRNTAMLCSAPGGASELMLIAGVLKADDRVVAVVHTVRIGMVVTVVPLMLRLLGIVGSAPVGQPLQPEQAIMVQDWLVLLACGLLGLGLGKLLRLPAGPLLCALFFSAAAHIGGITQVSTPPLLVGAAQIIIGCLVGVRFAKVREARALHSAVASMCWTLCLFGLALVAAYLGNAISGVKTLALFLGLAPGGLTEMSLLTIAVGVEVAFVTTCHLVRIVLVAIFVPVLVRRSVG